METTHSCHFATSKPAQNLIPTNKFSHPISSHWIYRLDIPELEV